VTATLVIPEHTVLHGESRERCWVWFPDGIDHGKHGDWETPKKVQVGMRGISDFTIEDLSIHSVFTKVLVAAPLSTLDLSIPDGSCIPIEERDPEEVRRIQGIPVTPPGVPVANPAFDITPHRYISAIITNRGIARPPFAESLRLLGEATA
jgi:hypothetical protein